MNTKLLITCYAGALTGIITAMLLSAILLGEKITETLAQIGSISIWIQILAIIPTIPLYLATKTKKRKGL